MKVKPKITKEIALARIKSLEKCSLNCGVFSIYDYDGYTMQELLCQFFEKINELADSVNNTLELVEWLVNEGLELAVLAQLEIWLEDGTLAELINVTIFEELNAKLDGVILDVSKYFHYVRQEEDLQDLIDNYKGVLVFNGGYTYDKQIDIKDDTKILGMKGNLITFNVSGTENGFMLRGNNFYIKGINAVINSVGTVEHGGQNCVFCSGDYASDSYQTYRGGLIEDCYFYKEGANKGRGNVIAFFGGSNNHKVRNVRLDGGDGILCHWAGNFDPTNPHTSPATVSYHPNNIEIENVVYEGETQAIYISSGYNIKVNNVKGKDCTSMVQIFCGDYANKIAQYEQKGVLSGIRISNIFGQNISANTVEINGRGKREQDPIYNVANSVEKMDIEISNVQSVSGADSQANKSVISMRWGTGGVKLNNINTIYNTVNSPLYTYEFSDVVLENSYLKGNNPPITVLGCEDIIVKNNIIESDSKITLVRVESYNGLDSYNVTIEDNTFIGGYNQIVPKGVRNLVIRHNKFKDYKGDIIYLNSLDNAVINPLIEHNLFYDGGESIATAIYGIRVSGCVGGRIGENLFLANTKNLKFTVLIENANHMKIENNISYGGTFANFNLMFISSSIADSTNYVNGNIPINTVLGTLNHHSKYTVESV